MRIRKELAATVVAVLLIGSILGQAVRASAFDNSGYIEGRASELQEPFYHSRKPVEYSYVYFGSYPQSEVTGEALTPAVTLAVYDAYGDAQVGEDKYRMVEKDGSRRYFRYEPIRWRVIRTEKYEKEAYLLADSVLDYECYQAESQKEGWKESDIKYCDIFMWLNSRKEGTKGFTDTAFNLQEKRDIKDYNLYVLDNGENKCITESAVVPNFYNDPYRKIYESGECKDIGASSYAKMQSGESEDSRVKWWCGEIYDNNGVLYAPYVNENGILQEEGAPVNTKGIGVCPMIVVSTKEDAVWKSEREVQLEQGIIMYDKNKAAVVHTPEQENGNISFSRIYMGSYPQSEVTGEALTEEIMAAFTDENHDRVVRGVKYRRVKETDGWHYYRFEPVCWRVLYVNEGTRKAFLVAEKILDYHFYDKGGNTEERCSQLVQWLNSYGGEADSYGESADGFLNEAFEDKGECLETVLTRFMGESIKVTMLQSYDMRYLMFSRDSAIGLQTAYASSKCNGEVAETPAKWWLLTERDTLAFAGYVDKKGIAHTNTLTMDNTENFYAYAEDTTIGVRPAVILDLTKTDAWMMEEEKQKEDRRVMGNVNEDEEITLEDAALVLKAALKIQALSSKRLEAYADMDGNGRVELADAQLVLRKALKID